jgi:trans-aconitate methyltransferase
MRRDARSRWEAFVTDTTSPIESVPFDPSVPNVARMYDYYLGGKDNYAADREAAEQALSVAPELRVGAREIRRFIHRVVRYLVDAGIRQFIDIGCGLPTQGNVHEIAHAAAPDARVVYVDNDPVVVSHARALLERQPYTIAVKADAREPQAILSDPDLRRLIDLDQPVAIMMVAVLHVIPDDELVRHIVGTLRDAMVPGSYLAIAEAVADLRPETTAKLASLYQNRTAVQGPYRSNLRNKEEIEPYFDGLELVAPGVVFIPQWNPDPEQPTEDGAENTWAVGGVARKP